MLAAVQYPDPTTGNPSSSQQETYTVNALGQNTTFTDRNGNVHSYSYDVLGRQTADAVTTLGSGVDGSIRRIATAYDTQGNAYLFTSYDAASGGNVINQVEDVFNGLGQLTGEYQSHSGAVVIGTTPEVQYTYSQMAGGANHSRLTGIVYPNGYTVAYNYASGLDDTLSRLTSLSDNTGTDKQRHRDRPVLLRPGSGAGRARWRSCQGALRLVAGVRRCDGAARPGCHRRRHSQ